LESIRRIYNRDKIFFLIIFSNIVEGNLIVTVDNIPGKNMKLIHVLTFLKKFLLQEYEPEIVSYFKKY
jgi:hypothetical protein